MTFDARSAALRTLVADAVANLTGFTHRELDEVFARLGLPEGEGSKRQRVTQAVAAVADGDLPAVARRLLDEPSVGTAARHAIQDALWAGQGAHEIPKRTRREIARSLDLGDLVYDAARFRSVLDRWWVLGEQDPFEVWLGSPATGLGAQIDQHVFRNPGDWDTEYLFDRLGAIDAGDTRFTRFLEDLASADAVPDEPTQRRIAAAVNAHLRPIGAELRETGTDGGYPAFSVVSIAAAHARRPKNLIFAAPTKPDIRFRDAIDNDIEVVGNPDETLVYDRPITGDGLRWRDLQAWWKDKRHLSDETEAKKTLYDRLRDSLPGRDVSPPQLNLYELYHEIHGPAVYDLPALLPEVWLHWDPKTVRERGAEALLRHRMDFLMLLPHGQRVVLEVDGAHHYSRDGRADGAAYAANVRGDRDLKLAGYEVFRFGAVELRDRDAARALLRPFFADLFRRFGVTAVPV